MHQSTGSYELVVAAIAAAAVGFGIDYWLGLTPLFTLIFSIAGFVGAGYSLWIKYQMKMVDENADRTARKAAKSVSPLEPIAGTVYE